MAVSHSARTGSLPIRSGETGAKAFAPARGAGNDGQWKADSREPGHRCPARRQAFLLPRGLGATFAARVSGLHGLRGCRTDHSLELSTSYAGLEDRARVSGGKYRRPEAG